jgi:hypothetical protein
MKGDSECLPDDSNYQVKSVVNWLLTYQKILWTHMDPQGHVTKEGSRDTFIDKTQVYKGRT